MLGRNCRTWRHFTSGVAGAWGLKIGARILETDCTSPIRPRLLSEWASVAHDPRKASADWVRHDAPAGILSQPLLAGVFNLAQLNDEGVLEPENLVGDVEVFRNYDRMDEDEDVWSQVHEFVEKGFLKAFGSLPECEEYLGGTPVFSRFGQVTKVRFGKLKRRLILDVKQSRVREKELAKFIVSHYRGQQTWSMTSRTCCTIILWARTSNWISWCLILWMHFGTYH